MCSNLGDHQLEIIVCVCIFVQLPRHVQLFVPPWAVCVCILMVKQSQNLVIDKREMNPNKKIK